MNSTTVQSCISEKVQVVAVDGDWVWVEAQTKSACSSCSAHKACGNGAMAQLMSSTNARRFRIRNDFEARLKEWVVVGWPDGPFLRTVAKAYLVPSVLCIIFACMGGLISEGASALGALLGMGLGLAALRPKRTETSKIVFMHRLKEQTYE